MTAQIVKEMVGCEHSWCHEVKAVLFGHGFLSDYALIEKTCTKRDCQITKRVLMEIES